MSVKRLHYLMMFLVPLLFAVFPNISERGVVIGQEVEVEEPPEKPGELRKVKLPKLDLKEFVKNNKQAILLVLESKEKAAAVRTPG